MKTPAVLVFALCAIPGRADLSYDVRETTVAHPSLGMKTKESLAHVTIKLGTVATRQNDIVQIVDAERNLITLIDYRTQTFAISNWDEAQRGDDRGFDSIQAGIRSELIQSGQVAEWNGVAVKRDVARTSITGGEAPGELLVTSDWIDDIPGFAESRRALESGDDRHVRELEAEIQSLVLTHPDRFADGLKIRKNAAGRSGFQIHSLTEIRLAADAPMLKTISALYSLLIFCHRYADELQSIDSSRGFPLHSLLLGSRRPLLHHLHPSDGGAGQPRIRDQKHYG